MSIYTIKKSYSENQNDLQFKTEGIGIGLFLVFLNTRVQIYT
jgi:hypothetical protein